MAVKTVFASEISQLFDKTTPLFPKTPYLCSVAAVKVPQHYIIKALLTLCFWMFELPQSKSSLKQMLGNCHGVLYMLSVVCWGYKYLQAHFTDVSYTPNVGVYLPVYYFGCGRPEHQAGGSQAPTSFLCSLERS